MIILLLLNENIMIKNNEIENKICDINNSSGSNFVNLFADLSGKNFDSYN
jgi:hypothetical protein